MSDCVTSDALRPLRGGPRIGPASVTCARRCRGSAYTRSLLPVSMETQFRDNLAFPNLTNIVVSATAETMLISNRLALSCLKRVDGHNSR